MAEINYLADVQPYESIPGIDDTKIAAILSGMTSSVISVRAAKQYFRRGLPVPPPALPDPLWRKSPDGVYSGKLQLALDKTDNPDWLRAGLSDIWAALFDDSAEDCGTTSAEYAPVILAVVTKLVDTNQITKAECDAFYALGGGLRFSAGVKDTDIASARKTHNDAQSEQLRREALDARWAHLENNVLEVLKANETDKPGVGELNAALLAELQ